MTSGKQVVTEVTEGQVIMLADKDKNQDSWASKNLHEYPRIF